MKTAIIILIAAALAPFHLLKTPTKEELEKAKTNTCFSGNCRNGTGVMITSWSGYYEGEFVDGKFHGKGEKYYGGKLEYKGEFKNGKADGKGTSYHDKKIIHTGEYKNGLYHGKGTYYDIDHKRKYEGEFKDGTMDGKCVLTGEKGIRYEGHFLKGRKHGKGTLTNGIVTYDGEWRENYPHGEGKLFHKDGKIILQGTWKKTAFKSSGCAPAVGDCENGRGLMITFYEGISTNKMDYYTYEGEWKNGDFHGKGKLTWPGGQVEKGQFSKGTYTAGGGPEGIKAWVKATGGLRLRDRPSTGGAVVAVIPNYREVELLEETGDVVTISGASGKWSRVKYMKATGWAFGGFLSLEEPDKSDLRKELRLKLQGFPRVWTELTLIQGKYFIYQHCHAQVTGISIDIDAPDGPVLYRALGQSSDEYSIWDVEKTKTGAVFTITDKFTSKPGEYKFEMIRDTGGKKVLWKRNDGGDASYHIPGNYRDGNGTPDFPFLKEKGGECGLP